MEAGRAKIVGDVYELALWMFQRANRFPRNWRVTLGDSVEQLLLGMIVKAQQAATERDKLEELLSLSRDLEALRIHLRLCRDLECLDVRQYGHASERLTEIGRQLGGWIKQQRGRREA